MVAAPLIMSEQEEDWLRTREVAALLGVHRKTVSRWCLTGELPAVVVDTEGTWVAPTYRVRRSDAQTFGARLALRTVKHGRRLAYVPPGSNVEPPRPGDKAAGYPILSALRRVSGIPRVVLEGTGRAPAVVSARRVAVYLLHHDAGLGPLAIGRLLRRNHATILWHLTVTTAGLSYEDQWAITEVRRELARAARQAAPR